MDRLQDKSSQLLRTIVAVLILAVAAWLLLKLVIGVIAGIAWAIAAVIAVVAVIWALRQL